MPNWCTNHLIITGAREDRERFAEAVIAFPDEDEKAEILAEQRRRDERPFVVSAGIRSARRARALDALAEDERADAEARMVHEEEVAAAAAHVEAAAAILQVDRPSPEDYARAVQERPESRLWPLERLEGMGTWEEILAEVDARRERSAAYEAKKREEIGLQYFDEDGVQARWLSFAALMPVGGPGPTTSQVIGQADSWGTKWEPQYTEREMSDDALTYRFDTAWTPPDGWLMTIARWYPELTFRMASEEADSDIARVIVIEGGEVTVDDTEFDRDQGWYSGAAQFFAGHGFDDMAERMRERADEYEDED